jgi:hypothetical protein
LPRGAKTRPLAIAAVLLIAGVFVVMWARFSWYALMQWPALDSTGALGPVVVSVERSAFWVALFVGVAGWIYIDSRGIPAALSREYRRQLRRFAALCMAAAGALIVSVASDGVLTALRLAGTGWSVQSLLPVFSMGVEIACAGLMISYMRGLARTTWRLRGSGGQ